MPRPLHKGRFSFFLAKKLQGCGKWCNFVTKKKQFNYKILKNATL